jgi:glucose-1-phosphate thymidylyltransferase
MAVVGVIPAAGFATRLQGLPCSKEVLPVGGRPVMDYLVERMRTAGCSEVRLVTRPEKTDVALHAKRSGVVVRTANPKTVSASIAVALRGLEPDDIVLLGFPDTIWEPVDGYRPLVSSVEAGAEVALGLFRTSEPERCDVVTFDDAWRITGVEIKSPTPSSNWIWACAAARVRSLVGLEREREPGDRFHELARHGVVLGIPLSDHFLDIGTAQGLRDATEALGARSRASAGARTRRRRR